MFKRYMMNVNYIYSLLFAFRHCFTVTRSNTHLYQWQDGRTLALLSLNTKNRYDWSESVVKQAVMFIFATLSVMVCFCPTTTFFM